MYNKQDRGHQLNCDVIRSIYINHLEIGTLAFNLSDTQKKVLGSSNRVNKQSKAICKKCPRQVSIKQLSSRNAFIKERKTCKSKHGRFKREKAS